MSLRSILGGSARVKKSSKGSSSKRPSPSSSWTSSLPRGKPGSKGKMKPTYDVDDEEDDLFSDKLDDCGLVKILATDLNFRDTAQAIQYIRGHMFSQIPEQRVGMNSTRISEVLNYRRQLPPIVTVAHIQTLLTSPSAVEREIAELTRCGFLRKIVVTRRGEIGETVLLSADLDKMIEDSAGLPEATKTHFRSFLREHPATQTVSRASLAPNDIDQLFKAGFLTAHHSETTSFSSLSNTMYVHSRPEDKTTLVSLETVSKQPAGSMGAVGRTGGVHMAGGSGGGSRMQSSIPVSVTELRLAIPGNGVYLRLVSSALAHLVSLLDRSRFREAPEGVLRERWDGGASKDEVYTAKRSRGEFTGILPGHTRKWKQFYGLNFEWVLQEAVGSGLVEVFETKSVGRGVRVI